MSAPVDLLAAVAAAHPDKPAVIEDRPKHPVVTWSWAELDRQANRFANALRKLNIRPGQTVVWCGMNSPTAALSRDARTMASPKAVHPTLPGHPISGSF